MALNHLLVIIVKSVKLLLGKHYFLIFITLESYSLSLNLFLIEMALSKVSLYKVVFGFLMRLLYYYYI